MMRSIGKCRPAELIAFVSIAFCGLSMVAPAAGAMKVQANRVAEVALISGRTYRNPFVETELSAVVTQPGGSKLLVPMFWAGGKRWCLRYSSSVAGWGRPQQSGKSTLVQVGLDGFKRHWRNLVARYGAYPTVWMVGGEAKDAYGPWSTLAEYLKDIDPATGRRFDQGTVINKDPITSSGEYRAPRLPSPQDCVLAFGTSEK